MRTSPLSENIPPAGLYWGQNWLPACCNTSSSSRRPPRPSKAQGAAWNTHKRHLNKADGCLNGWFLARISCKVESSAFVFLCSSSRWQHEPLELSPWTSPTPPWATWTTDTQSKQLVSGFTTRSSHLLLNELQIISNVRFICQLLWDTIECTLAE